MTKETKTSTHKNAENKEQEVVKKVENKSTIDKKLVIKLFNKGLTPYQIAKQIGKYYSQVAPIIEKEGLTWEKRPAGPTDKKSRTIYCNDKQYKAIKAFLSGKPL